MTAAVRRSGKRLGFLMLAKDQRQARPASMSGVTVRRLHPSLRFARSSRRITVKPINGLGAWSILICWFVMLIFIVLQINLL